MPAPFSEYNASATRYRYGFNGKENDNDVKGTGNQQDYGMRIYDPRLSRFLSVDPLTAAYPWYTPYQFAGNTPIQAVDVDGLEPWNVNSGSLGGATATVYGPYRSQADAQEAAKRGDNTIELKPLTVTGTRNLLPKSSTSNNSPGRNTSSSSSNFKRYQEKVFKHEGGFVNDPADPGGATNKGIIFSNFRQWSKKDLGVEPTLDNLKNLTVDQAAVIYKIHYWDRIRGDEFDNGSVAFAIYDWSVTSGGAVRELEKLFAVMTNGITVDSKFSSSEVALLNNLNSEKVFNMVQEQRLSYYGGLIERSISKYKKSHPFATESDLKKNTLLKFKRGWERRVKGIKYESN